MVKDTPSNKFTDHLLELLIDKVDTDLLEGVKLENFKSGDVEDTNEGDLLHRRIYESVVAHVYNITEETAIDVLDDGTDADFAGVGVPTCCNIVSFGELAITNSSPCILG